MLYCSALVDQYKYMTGPRLPVLPATCCNIAKVLRICIFLNHEVIEVHCIGCFPVERYVVCVD